MTPSTICKLIGHRVEPDFLRGTNCYFCPRCLEKWGPSFASFSEAYDIAHWNKWLKKAAIIVGVLWVLFLASECSGAITPQFLDAVAQIESGGRADAVGDKGKSIGAFQLKAEAWADVNGERSKFGLVKYPYSCATNYQISRLYSAQYLILLRSQLRRSLSREPNQKELLATYQQGFSKFKSRGFNIKKTPSTVQRNIAKLK